MAFKTPSGRKFTMEDRKEWLSKEAAPIKAIREAAEQDLVSYIRLIAPERVLGHVHEDMADFLQNPEGKSHKLVLIPRAHQKSAMIAYYVAWSLVRDPIARFLYVSATSNLAEKQLGFIRNIFDAPLHRKFWPLLVHPEERFRERWTLSELAVDDPLRRQENVRDVSIMSAGMTTSLTGLHFSEVVLDDVVVPENAYTQDGRDKVASQCSMIQSILDPDSNLVAVGTVYHQDDQYTEFQSMNEDIYNDDGDIIDEEPIFEVFKRVVEDVGDGTGNFLWPRTQRADGKYFGFDRKILAKKRGTYSSRLQFLSQYYLKTFDEENEAISREWFQYYEPSRLLSRAGSWHVGTQKLNIVAAIDFAYSIGKRSDYTAIAVVGMDGERNYYVLDLVRFKKETIRDYYEAIMRMQNKWGFRKLRAETVAAQQAIVRELKKSYLIPNGISLTIEEVKPDRTQGVKEDRIAAVLEPKYSNGQVWHMRGGMTQLLEDELVDPNPKHDDLKDSLSMAMDGLVAPMARKGVDFRGQSSYTRNMNERRYSRFGGMH